MRQRFPSRLTKVLADWYVSYSDQHEGIPNAFGALLLAAPLAFDAAKRTVDCEQMAFWFTLAFGMRMLSSFAIYLFLRRTKH